ncbi:hypothetical protein Poly30_56890 [Planctomycetes bacterium Poly30]|uniref:Beta-lactamase class A catalytic domain-containing protein n=1 Tax=Saltatorellus ferox TaxID=2528018 RepID=A0A518F1B0_9BACT|nr:hypothetical protein Poly30_56890 [Planctomycetes bacterium Poly30]
MKLLRSLFLALAACMALIPSSAADPQTDTVTPTGWWWMTNVTAQTVSDRVAQGYRIVDIEIEDDSPFRLSAAFVRNTGDYAKGWWWYYGLTESQVTSNVISNQARLIDVEPYETVAGIRYAAVMIANTGSDFATSHGWQTNHTFSSLSTWLQQNPTRRILDIQPYRNGGSLRYAFVWVANSGNTQSAYWIYLNTSTSFISSRLASNQARLIDLEPHDDTGNFSAIMVPRDGNEWTWFHNMTSGDIGRLADQYATRIIDLERYRTSSGAIRYAMVCRRNDNDLAIEAAFAMRQGLPLDATSGLVLREYQGTDSTLAGVFEDRVFEPASLIKTVHHFTANRRVALNLDSFNSPMTENQGLNGSCPTGSNPTTRTLGAVLRSMMESSSNTATEAVRSRYGTAVIESTAASFGATNVELNHTLGCLCGQPRNEITLRDLADLHGAVIDGALGSVRDDFYDRMSNSSNFGMGSFNTGTILTTELNSSSLNSSERAAFLAGTAFAHKGGSYTCNSSSGSEQHRSRGAYVRLPERSGCQTIGREYFIGAWVNDANTAASANDSVGAGLAALFRDRVRAAIQTWENANCNAFQNYCTATINSSGQRGVCSATGSPYILDNNLRLVGSSLPPSSFASVIFGTSRVFVPNPGGSAGNLCVGGTIGRLYSSIGTTSASGVITFTVDNTDLQSSQGTQISLDPGDTLMFQWWSRDASPSGPTSNFTNALEVTFI